MAIYIDDRELVAAHQAGDTDAFDELVREYRSSLLSHAWRKLRCESGAEDAVQETLVRAYRALPNFNGEYRLGPWLHRIMSNVCIDEANRRQRDGDKTDRLAAQPISRVNAPGVEEQLGLQVDDSRLQSALADLPETHREALTLRFVDELDYEQVAQASGVSEQNARARVSRARTAMRAAMKGVAAVPVLLVGVMKRGEKAAAAATAGTTATAAATSASSTSAVLPAVTEATVAVAHAAPAALPVVAKAAVGIGLAAAVFTPTSDSAVHLAAEAFVSGSAIVESDAGVSLEGEANLDGESSQLATIALVEEGRASRDESISDAYSPIETVSPSTEQSSDPAATEASSLLSKDSAIGSSASLGGSMTMAALEINRIGGDRYTLAGPVQLTIESNSFEGRLSTATWLRVEGEVDSEGRRRVDGLFDLELNEGKVLLVRLAGFAEGELDGLRVAGLFRVDANTLGIAGAGSFNGSMALNGSPGTVVLTLTP